MGSNPLLYVILALVFVAGGFGLMSTKSSVLKVLGAVLALIGGLGFITGLITPFAPSVALVFMAVLVFAIGAMLARSDGIPRFVGIVVAFVGVGAFFFFLGGVSVELGGTAGEVVEDSRSSWGRLWDAAEISWRQWVSS